MQIIPLNLDSVLLLLHNSKLAYYSVGLAQWRSLACIASVSVRFGSKEL